MRMPSVGWPTHSELWTGAEEIYERGYIDGYEIAEEEFKVFATCYRCRRPHLPVTSVKMKEAVARAVTGWGGTGCQ